VLAVAALVFRLQQGIWSGDFNQLSEAEKRHFYKCGRCGEMVEIRQLDDVLFHEDHVHRPAIQYGGSERLGESKQ
jgi:hypothetical protein